MKAMLRGAAAAISLLALSSLTMELQPARAQGGHLIVYTYYVYNDAAKTDLRDVVTGRWAAAMETGSL